MAWEVEDMFGIGLPLLMIGTEHLDWVSATRIVSICLGLSTKRKAKTLKRRDVVRNSKK